MAKLNKSKGEWAKELKKKNLEKRKRANIKKSVARPHQKQEPKKKSKFTKIVPDTIKKIKKIFKGDNTAKAADVKIKKKPLSPAQKKRSTAVQKAEDARRKRQKDNMKKDAAKAHYSSVPGYKGKAGGQNTKSKSYREKLADQKKKANRADVRDAARGGFKSVSDMERKGAITRIGKRVRKQDKAELTKLKGRR